METMYFSSHVDEHGKNIERTRDKFPYSYDGYVIWRGGENTEVNETIYSDRLLQEDHQKTRELMKKHFGSESDYYSHQSVNKIEKFLSEWMGKKVKLIFIMEYCNKTSGYPYWRFDIKK